MNNNITKKIEEEFINWANYNIQKIMNYCGMGNISISLGYDKHSCTSELTGGNVVFTMKYDRPYKRVAIKYYDVSLDMFTHGRYADLLMGLTHEVSHIITYPLLLLAEDRYVTERSISEINEEATEDIAGIVRKLILKTEPDYFSGGRTKKQNSKKANRIAKKK